MRKRLNLGNSDFKDMIINNNYFVDKSLLIEEVIKAERQVMLFPRPRRFGKTLNLSMLKYFFDINEKENEKLFKELEIWQTENNIKNQCGKYPVIFISFKDAKEQEWQNCYELIIAEIIALYRNHKYLITNDILDKYEKQIFMEILSGTASKTEYQRSIKKMCEYLYRYHNKKTVILIDEYDTPIHAGYGKFYDKIIPFMRNLLSGAFKDNSNLYKGIITGILRVSKESIFSGLNNLSVFDILKTGFSDKFGFTEKEIKKILEDFNLKEEYLNIKKWYNGYKFGKTKNIYNPWSLLNYVTEHEDGFNTFWVNTSSDILIKKQLKEKNATEIRKDLLKLINNESIKKDIENNFIFPDLDTDQELLWTLLIYSGYLTSKNKISFNEYELIIPNEEIKTVFTSTIIKWLRVDVKVKKTLLQETANYLINNELKKFEIGFREIMGDTFSYYDTAKNHEYVYHSYVLGLLAIIGDDYIIKSNRESGRGRYDIMLIPHDKTKNGIVIEIKQTEKQKPEETYKKFAERINIVIKYVLMQIDKNKYYKELIINKIKPENIIKIPIIFADKEPYITPMKLKKENPNNYFIAL